LGSLPRRRLARPGVSPLVCSARAIAVLVPSPTERWWGSPQRARDVWWGFRLLVFVQRFVQERLWPWLQCSKAWRAPLRTDRFRFAARTVDLLNTACCDYNTGLTQSLPESQADERLRAGLVCAEVGFTHSFAHLAKPVFNPALRLALSSVRWSLCLQGPAPRVGSCPVGRCPPRSSSDGRPSSWLSWTTRRTTADPTTPSAVWLKGLH